MKMKMTRGIRISLFVILVIVGLGDQLCLARPNNCHEGVSALVVDAWVFLHLIVATIQRRFLEHCVMGGILVMVSTPGILIIYDAVFRLLSRYPFLIPVQYQWY